MTTLRHWDTHKKLQKHYDYIITGAGCAGMSLLMRMMRDNFFSRKKILIIDRQAKTDNDRTWCFWEKQAGIFESIVTHRWDTIDFFSADMESRQSLGPYQYKMIAGIDLYRFVQQESSKHANIEWKQDTVVAIDTTGDKGMVLLLHETITADWIFNSIVLPKTIQRSKYTYHLLQHFTGWMIKTQEPCFDPSVATFMDFRISQEDGTAFMYVLPVDEREALIEYTLFSENLLQRDEYEKALRVYISERLGIQDYAIVHSEQGVIPMTNQFFPRQDGRVVYIGTAGGQVKGSSGYAFQFIQKRSMEIIDLLKKNKKVFDRLSLAEKKFLFYDTVLLHILHHQKMPGNKIFAELFKNNPAEKLFTFLDNESALNEDIAIMRSVPSNIFFPAAMKEMVYQLFRK